ncbi:glycosyltransferase family 4 protein [Lacinutrix venerupis]|uniref:Glycoside hydrolase n=1 Tax=Lacinutrix venerupis TaxID=1486034 RepID=A0AAC9LL72_9FLAO|nr:glycosyltransferase family 4 protein [Lacinutrix venerupis]APY00721.1 glycoside hydrolase [Lacinutrix venerupis]
MKIAFITPEYPHESLGHSGGIGTSIKHLAMALVKQKHKVSVLVYGQKEDGFFKDGDITIYKIKNPKIKGLSWFLAKKKIEKLANTLHSENKIDIIEAPDWTGISSFINPTCPLVLRLHGSDSYFCHLDNRKVKTINKYHEKKAFKNADGIISVSKYTAQLTNTLFGLNRNFKVIHNGINLKLFSPQENTSTEKTILYFGTLIRKKGLLELPYIFNLVHEKHPKVKLVLVGKDSPDITTGNPSTWQLMKYLFTKTSIKQVDYKGAVDYSKMQNLIKKANVCVFPTFAEALPVSWIEAMAMEKAVVASNIGWAKEVINDKKEGFLVHPTEHNIFANRILELLENETLSQQFGIAARKKVETTFSNDLVAMQSVEFYSKTIKEKSK